MARTGLSKHAVYETIDKLLASGQEPTNERIRSALGTGSMSTIQQFLKQWRTEQETKHGFASSIPTELSNAVSSIWKQIQNSSEERISQAKDELDTVKTKIENQLNEERKESTQLKTRVDELEKQLKNQIQLKEHAQRALDVEIIEITKLQERNNALRQQAETDKTEKDRLHQQFKTIQSNLEHYQAETQKAREEQAQAFEKQCAAYENKIQNLNNDLAIDRNKLIAAQHSVDKLSIERDQLQKTLEQTHEQHQKLQKDLATVEARFEITTEKNTELTKTNQTFKEKLENTEKQLNKAETETTLLHNEIKNLHKNAVDNRHALELLISEKNELEKTIAVLKAQQKQLEKNINNR